VVVVAAGGLGKKVTIIISFHIFRLTIANRENSSWVRVWKNIFSAFLRITARLCSQ
jgi:hypothetical protein